METNVVNIVVGKQGAGKTLFLVYNAYKYAFNEYFEYKRINALNKLKKLGYNVENGYKFSGIYTPKDVIFRLTKRGRPYKYSKNINIDNIDNLFICPNSLILIPEAQKFFNARKWQQFDRDKSEIFEFSRHYNIQFFLDTQNLFAIEKTLRSFSRIFFIVETKLYNYANELIKNGEYMKECDFLRAEIYFINFANDVLYEKYRAGQKDIVANAKIEKIVIEEDNILEMYNSQYLFKEFLPKNKTKKLD